MANEHKTAMARIISDMIKADNIIEEKEISCMQAMMRQYSISQKNMSDARTIRFSDAVNILQELSLALQRCSVFDEKSMLNICNVAKSI